MYDYVNRLLDGMQKTSFCKFPVPHWPEAHRGPSPTVVLYHDVSTPGSPFTRHLGVSIDPDTFRYQIRYLARHFDIISAEDLLASRLPRRPLLITFDDAYKSSYEVGAAILHEFNAPSLFFINPDSLLPTTVPTDNLLSLGMQLLGAREFERLLRPFITNFTSVREFISRDLITLTFAEIGNLRAGICTRLGASELELRAASGIFVNAEDLRNFNKYRITVGNHSMRHGHFRTLSEQELRYEIGDARLCLEALCKQTVSCLAIPYGHRLDATQTALCVARQSGHQAIFLVHGRGNHLRPATDIFYRISLDNASPLFLPVSLCLMPAVRTLYARLKDQTSIFLSSDNSRYF